MSINDRDINIGGAKGVDVFPGVANPLATGNRSNALEANFVSHGGRP